MTALYVRNFASNFLIWISVTISAEMLSLLVELDKTQVAAEAVIGVSKGIESVLQPLRWLCVDCVIHHERDVREE